MLSISGLSFAELLSLLFFFTPSREINVEHRGVFVTTFFAAKGLTFPIVIIPYFDEIPYFSEDQYQNRPTNDASEIKESTKWGKILFTSCTRSKHSLVIKSKNLPWCINPQNSLNFSIFEYKH